MCGVSQWGSIFLGCQLKGLSNATPLLDSETTHAHAFSG